MSENEWREPIFHSHITDGLPDDHPLATSQIKCQWGCGKLLHASNNECMRVWIETGQGNYCLPCFVRITKELVDTPWALPPVNHENDTATDMADTHKFTIRAPLDGRTATVEVDGRPLNGVCRVSFDINADNRPTTIYLRVIGEVEVDGEFRDDDIVLMRRPLL